MHHQKNLIYLVRELGFLKINAELPIKRQSRKEFYAI